MSLKPRLIWVACAAAVPAIALAGEAFDGRWATNASACSDAEQVTASVLITSQGLTWPGAACIVGTSYRVGETWHIGARCYGEGSVSNVALKLTLRGERLVVDWPHAKPEWLTRCPS
ncbi:MAG: hypothetical protein ACJ8F3_06215 [Xanthobacteraceae bacterium]